MSWFFQWRVGLLTGRGVSVITRDSGSDLTGCWSQCDNAAGLIFETLYVVEAEKSGLNQIVEHLKGLTLLLMHLMVALLELSICLFVHLVVSCHPNPDIVFFLHVEFFIIFFSTSHLRSFKTSDIFIHLGCYFGACFCLILPVWARAWYV